jgi:hypothetical protein
MTWTIRLVNLTSTSIPMVRTEVRNLFLNLIIDDEKLVAFGRGATLQKPTLNMDTAPRVSVRSLVFFR